MAIAHYAMKKDLAKLLPIRVVDTFKTLFDLKVIKIFDPDFESNDDDMIGKVCLLHSDIKIIIRFSFQRSTLTALLAKVYSDPSMHQHEAAAEDAVCEIVNIVCMRLKSQLNEDGYAFEIDLPTIDCDFRKNKDEDETLLNINFMLDKGSFLIELDIEDQIKEKAI